nr:protein FAM240C [Syngnathus scovelli]
MNRENYDSGVRRKEESHSLENTMMNTARIHDKQKVKFFWERRINQHIQQMVEEERRGKSSALARLRVQWLVKLDRRNEHQQGFLEERIRRSQNAQQRLTGCESPLP